MNDNRNSQMHPHTSIQSVAQIKRSTSCYERDRIRTINGLVPVVPFQCTEFEFIQAAWRAPSCSVLRLQERAALYAPDAKERYVGWNITLKGFYLLTGPWKLGASQLLHSGTSLYCCRTDKQCMAASRIADKKTPVPPKKSYSVLAFHFVFAVRPSPGSS